MKKDKGQLTKENILKHAADIFIEKGFSASRTSEIAKEAGVSEATVFKYYKSKQGLLDAIVTMVVDHVSTEFIVEPIEEIFEEYKYSTPQLLMKKLFLNRLQLIKDHKKYAMVALMESRFNMRIRKKLIKYIYPQIEEMGTRIIDYYSLKGIFRKDLDPWITMRTAMMGVVGIVFSSEFLGLPLKNDSLEDELDAIIEFLMRGLLSEEYCRANIETVRSEGNEQE